MLTNGKGKNTQGLVQLASPSLSVAMHRANGARENSSNGMQLSLQSSNMTNDSPRVDRPLTLPHLDNSLSDTKNDQVQNVAVEKKRASAKEIEGNKFFQPGNETVKIVFSDHSQSQDKVMQCQVLEPASDLGSEGGFEVFGLSRLEAITQLCEYAKDTTTVSDTFNKSIQIRETAAHEIRQAVLEDKLPEEMRTPEYKQLREQHKKAKEDFEKEMTAHCLEQKDADSSSLAQVMFHLHKKNKMQEYKKLLAAKQAWVRVEILLDNYCQSPAIFKQYLEIYYLKQKGQLRCLFDSEKKPILSMLDVVARHVENNLIVFIRKHDNEQKGEEEKLQPSQMVPIHLLNCEYNQTLYVVYETNSGDLSSGVYKLLQLMKALIPPESNKPKTDQSASYRVNLRRMEREQWQERWYHEALNGILCVKEDPSHLQLLAVLVGPPNNQSVIGREANALWFDVIRNQQKYVLYLAMHEIVSRHIRVFYQERVFDKYNEHLNHEEQIAVSVIERELSKINKDLHDIQDKIDHEKGSQYDEVRWAIKALEEKKVKEKEGSSDQIAELINIKKEELASMTPYYRDRQSFLRSKKQIEANKNECKERWRQAREQFELTRQYLSDDTVIKQYRMEIMTDSRVDSKSDSAKKNHESRDWKWVVSTNYVETVAQCVHRTADKKQANGLSRLEDKIGLERAKLVAKQVLSNFAHYEKKFSDFSNTKGNIEELKEEVRKRLEGLCQTLAVESVKLFENMLSNDMEKRKEGVKDLKRAFKTKFELICQELYTISCWHDLSSKTDLIVWNNKLKKRVEEAWEVWKKSDARRGELSALQAGDCNGSSERNTSIKQWEKEVQGWLKNQTTLVQKFVPGKTQEEGVRYLTNVGSNFGALYIDQLVDHPRSMHTLMHWTGLLLQSASEKEPGLSHLVDVACVLLKRGASLTKDCGKERIKEEKEASEGQRDIVFYLDFRNCNAKQICKMMLVYLENFISRGQAVESLRVALVEHANYVNLALNGSMSEMSGGSYFISLFLDESLKRTEMQIMGKLIYKMVESTRELNDDPIMNEIQAIKRNFEGKGIWEAIKALFQTPFKLLNQINKVSSNTDLIVVRLDANVERRKKEEAERIAENEKERRIQAEEKKIQADKRAEQEVELRKQADKKAEQEVELRRQADMKAEREALQSRQYEEKIKQLEEKLSKRDTVQAALLPGLSKSSPNVPSGLFQGSGQKDKKLTTIQSTQPKGPV